MLTSLLVITLAQVFGAVPASMVRHNRAVASQQRGIAKAGRCTRNDRNSLPGPVSFA